MDIKTYVKAELKKRSGELAAIARATKISRRTIGYLISDVERDINYGTLEKLRDHLKTHRRKKAP